MKTWTAIRRACSNGSIGACALLGSCSSAENPAVNDTETDGSGGIVLDGGGFDDNSSGDNDTFDVPDGGDGPAGAGPGDCNNGGGSTSGEYKFSIIWIANTGEGTVSKIDTVNAVELARYRTGPGANPDPSRTTVNLIGDVAIANRSGSVTKIAADSGRCLDLDADGVIRTSTGATDVLAWGEDECVVWHHDIEFTTPNPDTNAGGPRAIAWDAGTTDNNHCTSNPNLWVGWRDQPRNVATIRQLDGWTGAFIDEVEVDDWAGNWGHGTYGGAADAQGGFWALGTLGTLVRVDPETLTVQRWDNPQSSIPYGIALDSIGRPWLGGYDGHIWSFDADTESWTDYGDIPNGGSRLRGLAIDKNGDAWIAANEPCGLVRFDTESGTLLEPNIELPGCAVPVGVSIDFEGMVWVVDRNANVAYKVDPSDYAIETVEGLVAPYTYSDMTGAGLDLVVNPPVG